jgi:nitrogen fixation protein FixH
MKVLQTLSDYRWPLFLMGFLAMSVTAQGILVYVATRPDVPQPIAGFYERSQRWDDESALRAASQKLGWTVRFAIPKGEHYLAGMPRPVDVQIMGKDGQPVTGLSGALLAQRPSDQRLNVRGKLTELPHAAGRYRSLVRLAMPGIWELRVDANRGALHFVHQDRVSVDLHVATGGASE